jgi:hypothetical protein
VNALEAAVEMSADDVVDEISTAGVACLRDVVTEDWLEAARDGVESYLPINDGHELFIENFAADEGSFARRLVADERLEQLLKSVVTAACPQLNVHDQSAQSSLRILAGPGPAGRPLWFHYDATVVTLVVPIIIPDAGSGNSGELILYPNRRPYRRFAVWNIGEKLITQSDAYRRRFVQGRDGGADATVVPLQAGNVYLFWGYRSYHATLPFPADALRVTLVLHFGALHRGNRMLAAAKSLHQRMRDRQRARQTHDVGAGDRLARHRFDARLPIAARER